MDGIHDLGGREGFGPVDRSHEDDGFHEEWEARMFGIVRGMARSRDWSIDWFRHCRELIEPVDYLTRPYYDQWLQTYAAMMVNSGVATVAEIVSGQSASRPGDDLTPTMPPEAVAEAMAVAQRFDRESGPAPAFGIGVLVQVKAHGAPTHTRMPAYVRGAVGEVTHLRGNHVLPDANSLGDKRAEPLYTVTFDASALWPEAEGSRDQIHVDLWESYLDAI